MCCSAGSYHYDIPMDLLLIKPHDNEYSEIYTFVKKQNQFVIL